MATLGSRLRQARETAGKTQAAAGEAFGISGKAISQWENDRTRPDTDNLMKAARFYGVNLRWLTENAGEMAATDVGDPPGGAAPADLSRLPPRQVLPPPNASAPVAIPRDSHERMPVLGRGVGGADGRFKFNGQVIEYVTKPKELEGVADAYGVYVDGDSMRPRFKEGELLLVHPHRPPRHGDEVVVQLFPDDESEPPEGYVKEFRAWKPSKLVLRQFNPEKEFEIDRALVKSVHIIVGVRF